MCEIAERIYKRGCFAGGRCVTAGACLRGAVDVTIEKLREQGVTANRGQLVAQEEPNGAITTIIVAYSKYRWDPKGQVARFESGRFYNLLNSQ